MRVFFVFSMVYFFLTGFAGYSISSTYEDEDVLGLEISGELLAPPALVAQIAQDLAAIRTAYPEISDIQVLPDWIPGELLLGLTEEAWSDYEAGTFAELNALNAQYGPVSVFPFAFIRCLHLEFEQIYHPEVLANIYDQVEGVNFAEPNTYFLDGNDIYCQRISLYTFKRGWGDCEAGCIYADYWVFSVNGGIVELLTQYGTSWPTAGSSPSGLPARPVQNVPNPFNPNTMIQYTLAEGSWVRLQVYDARGRLIKDLQNEFVSQGEQRVPWDATDRFGMRVASGVYYYKLAVGQFVQTGKMALMK